MKFKHATDLDAYHEESDEEDYMPSVHKKSQVKKGGRGNASAPKADRGSAASRARPTNNQLLYKAHFRWQHECLKIKDLSSLILETDACPSVTSCFLQVLQGLHDAEQLRTVGTPRNILQILSTNTRRTKVVELSSGTHRVPDELKKHYLSDGEGGQYSTNLDRNRYGNDDNYLFTVIRYDLEFLGFCPCMVDVDIVDAKNGNTSTIVQSGLQACTCSNKAQHVAAAKAAAETMAMPMPVPVPNTTAAVVAAAINNQLQQAPAMMGGMKHGAPSPKRGRQLPGASMESPLPSNSGMSGLFDVLVMAATGEGAEGAAAPGGGGDAPVTSAYMMDAPRLLEPQAEPLIPMAAPAAIGAGASAGNNAHPAFPKPTGQGGQRMRPPPQRSRSRLWSALSMGDLDSLQNALDAYVKAEEEIVSKPFGGLSEALLPAGGPSIEPMARVRRRKPPRGNSSFLLRAADSSGCFSGLSKLGLSLGFKETSDDNIPGEELSKPGAPLVESGDEAEGEVGMGNDNIKDDAEGGEDRDDAPDAQQKRRVRYVPRQFSSVNMINRVNMASPEIKRMQTELETLRTENRRLKESSGKPQAAKAEPAADTTLLFSLEQELADVKAQVRALVQRCQEVESREQVACEHARLAEERGTALTLELAKTRAEVNVLLSKLVAAGSMQSGMQSGMQSSMQSGTSGNTALALALSTAGHNGKLMMPLGSYDTSSLAGQVAMLQQQQQQQQAETKAAMAAAMQNVTLQTHGGNSLMALLAAQQAQVQASQGLGGYSDGSNHHPGSLALQERQANLLAGHGGSRLTAGSSMGPPTSTRMLTLGGPQPGGSVGGSRGESGPGGLQLSGSKRSLLDGKDGDGMGSGSAKRPLMQADGSYGHDSSGPSSVMTTL